MGSSPRSEPTASAGLPLIAHRSPDAIVAWRGGRPIRAARFLADVAALAARMPAGEHVLNACADRYRFAVGLGAAMTTRRTSLLPSTRTPAFIAELRRLAPACFCLTDDASCDIEMPRLEYCDASADDETTAMSMPPVPSIPGGQVVALVFTSGSTGMPVPHRKTWGQLHDCVRAGATVLGLDGRAPHAIVATVPPQHMYGFESSVLLALVCGHALCADRPLFARDVCDTLLATPRPRALVTTPVHLRALLGAGIDLPATDLVVCATSPLEQELARATEEAFAAPLVEIYGATETGQMATRHTVHEAAWTLWPGVQLRSVPGPEGTLVLAHGGHVVEPTVLNDVVVPVGPRQFLLRGRTADMVDVAGKRSSLAHLDHHLRAIPGVLDGAFVVRDDADESLIGVARLAALVVAPGLGAAHVLRELRARIDAAFLPRPLLLVPQLPRNATGKLPRQALEALLASHERGEPQ